MFSDAQLLAYIGPNGAIGTAEATILGEIEERTVALVQRATGRFFGASGSYTFWLEGGAGTVIYLPDDVTAVASVSYRSQLSEDWTALESDQWEWHSENSRQILRVDGLEWPEGPSTVKVTATRGYATDAEPGEIRQLVLDLVSWQFRAGRNLSLEDLGSPDVGRVQGWDRVVNLFRGPLYG